MKTAFVYTTDLDFNSYSGDIFEYFRDTALRHYAEHVVVFEAPSPCCELEEFHSELLAYTNADPKEYPPVYFMTDDFGFIKRVVTELIGTGAHAALRLTPAQQNALHSRV